jgi:hypothetical protein
MIVIVTSSDLPDYEILNPFLKEPCCWYNTYILFFYREQKRYGKTPNNKAVDMEKLKELSSIG